MAIRNFLCDSGGSICEVVNPDDPADPVMTALSANLLMVWIKGSEAHTAELIRRFDRAPKPMYYQPDFLHRMWNEYLAEHLIAPEERWTRCLCALDLCPRAGPSPATLCGHGALGPHRDRRGCGEGADLDGFDDLIAAALAAQTPAPK
jgi:hypothetical protein